MILLFINTVYFLLFILWLGSYDVLDDASWALNELLKNPLINPKDRRIARAERNNLRKGKLILYIIYFPSFTPFFILNIGKGIIYFLLFFLTPVCLLLIPPLRNIIRNLAILILLKRKRVINFLVKGTFYKKRGK